MISKGNRTEKKTKGSQIAPFCHLNSSNEQKHTEEIKQEKTDETMVILFAVSIKNAFIPEKSLVSQKGVL